MAESLNENLTAYLREHRLIAELVTEPGVWVVGAPQSQGLPYIVYQRNDGKPAAHMTGVSDVAQANVSFSCYDDAPEGAADLADALVLALAGFRGFMDDIHVRVCALQTESQNYIAPTDGSDQGVFVENRDFLIWFLRTAPTSVEQPMRTA
jgi:hypothetical protein